MLHSLDGCGLVRGQAGQSCVGVGQEAAQDEPRSRYNGVDVDACESAGQGKEDGEGILREGTCLGTRGRGAAVLSVLIDVSETPLDHGGGDCRAGGAGKSVIPAIQAASKGDSNGSIVGDRDGSCVAAARRAFLRSGGRHPGEGSYTIDGGFSQEFLHRLALVWRKIHVSSSCGCADLSAQGQGGCADLSAQSPESLAAAKFASPPDDGFLCSAGGVDGGEGAAAATAGGGGSEEEEGKKEMRGGEGNKDKKRALLARAAMFGDSEAASEYG